MTIITKVSIWMSVLSLIDLSVSELIAPKLVPIVTNRSQNESTGFQIFCSAQEGSHPLFFEWFRNGQSLRSSASVKYKIDNAKEFSTFKIDKVDRSDVGNYSCVVNNMMGSDSQSVLLTVKGECFYPDIYLAI